MTDADYARLLSPPLHERLDTSGLMRVSVASGEDHGGGPILIVDLFFEGGDRSVDKAALSRAVFDVRIAIRDIGETRFPYIRLHIPDPADESLAA